MKTFNELDLQGLKWVKTGTWWQEYELRNQDDEVLAKLKRPRWWNYYAEVDAVGNRWSFERKGFWRPTIIVKTIGTGEESAKFHYEFYDGRLQFPDGRVYHWKQSDWWGSKWTWTEADGTPVIGFKAGGFLQINSEISIDPEFAVNTPSLALLIYLGWYLVTLYYEEASSTTLIIAAT